MRTLEIDYWTTLIDQRDENKFKEDIYFRKALSSVMDLIKATTELKIKPKSIFERAFEVITNPPYEKNEDPFKVVFP